MHTSRDVTRSLFAPLRWTYGLIPIIAGIDKFTNLLTDWEAYLHPGVLALLPIDAATFMRAIGIVEIAVGALVLAPRFTRIGAYLAMGWLAAIAAQLVALGRFDVAVRDLVMAVGAWTLAQLATNRERVEYTEDSVASAALEPGAAR